MEVQKVAQLYRCTPAQQANIFLIGSIRARIAGCLQLMDLSGLQRMRLTRGARLIKPADGEADDGLFPRLGMNGLGLKRNPLQTNAGNARAHAREEVGDQSARQAQGFEIIATAIRGNDRNPHLGQDFEKARFNRLFVIHHGLVQGQSTQQTTRMTIRNRLLRQIGVDAGRAHANQNSEIMGVDTFGRANGDGAIRPQAHGNQMGVHASCC